MIPTAVTQPINDSVSDDLNETEKLYKSEDEKNEAPKLELKKNVTVLHGLGLIVGTIIASGIFISPSGVISNTGSVGVSLIVWLACGIFASLGALCYSELGTAIPKQGAEYHYLYTAFGPVPAFLFAWTGILVIRPAAVAGVSMVFGSYVTKPFYPDCDPPVHLVKLCAFSCIGKGFFAFISFLLKFSSIYNFYLSPLSTTNLSPNQHN